MLIYQNRDGSYVSRRQLLLSETVLCGDVPRGWDIQPKAISVEISRVKYWQISFLSAFTVHPTFLDHNSLLKTHVRTTQSSQKALFRSCEILCPTAKWTLNSSTAISFSLYWGEAIPPFGMSNIYALTVSEIIFFNGRVFLYKSGVDKCTWAKFTLYSGAFSGLRSLTVKLHRRIKSVLRDTFLPDDRFIYTWLDNSLNRQALGQRWLQCYVDWLLTREFARLKFSIIYLRVNMTPALFSV